MNRTIDKIVVKNFMSWENATFEFSKGINVIYGVSDKGKSAILDGFNWLFNNDPSGNSFCSDWIKKETKNGNTVFTGITEYTVFFNDGVWVTRAMGKNTNEYRISTLKDPLIGFGTSVPREVKELLNMSDVNLQRQNNPIFLLMDSPAEISRVLNEISNLGEIDVAFKNIGSLEKDVKASIKACEKEISENIEKEQCYSWIEDVEEKLKEIEEFDFLVKKLDELKTKRNFLIKCRKDISEANGVIDNKETIEKIAMSLAILKDRAAMLTTLREKRKSVLRLLTLIDTNDKIIRNKEEIKKLNLLFSALKDLSLKITYLKEKKERALRLLEQIEVNNKIIDEKLKIGSLVNVFELCRKTNKKIGKMIEDENNFDILEEELINADKAYHLVKRQYEEIKPKTCPVCKKAWR